MRIYGTRLHIFNEAIWIHNYITVCTITKNCTHIDKLSSFTFSSTATASSSNEQTTTTNKEIITTTKLKPTRSATFFWSLVVPPFRIWKNKIRLVRSKLSNQQHHWSDLDLQQQPFSLMAPPSCPSSHLQRERREKRRERHEPKRRGRRNRER